MSLLEGSCDPGPVPGIRLSLLDSLSWLSQDTPVAGGRQMAAAPGAGTGEMTHYLYKREFDFKSTYGAQVGHGLLASTRPLGWEAQVQL